MGWESGAESFERLGAVPFCHPSNSCAPIGVQSVHAISARVQTADKHRFGQTILRYNSFSASEFWSRVYSLHGLLP